MPDHSTVQKLGRTLPDPAVVDVSFRELLPGLPLSELTHGIFPYPARLLKHIPRYILMDGEMTDGIDFIVDPFCGSGTILLEGLMAGIPAIGMDSNPIAALVSRVKTNTSHDQGRDRIAQGVLTASRFSRRRKKLPAFALKWFDPVTRSILERLAAQLDLMTAGPDKDFVSVGVALVTRKHAQRDPRIAVPVRSKAHRPPADWASVESVFERLSAATRSLSQTITQPVPLGVTVIEGDARNDHNWEHASAGGAGLLFTSPPYGAAQKYIRSVSLEAAVLGHTSEFGTRSLDESTIGRERLSAAEASIEMHAVAINADPMLQQIAARNPARALVYSAYLSDLRKVLNNASTAGVTRAVIVSGDNEVTGLRFPTRRYIVQMMIDSGFVHTGGWKDRIAGRTLLTTRKGGGSAAEHEYIDRFERRG